VLNKSGSQFTLQPALLVFLVLPLRNDVVDGETVEKAGMELVEASGTAHLHGGF
jgi:hypothetical protein